ncbi:hypothetical protein AB6D78_08480 [Vibrio splendidus]
MAEADILNLSEEIDKVLLAGADVIHLDMSEGQDFAIQFRPNFVTILREYAQGASIGVELGALKDESDIDALVDAAVDYILLRPPAVGDVSSAMKMIKFCGCKIGLSLNGESDIERYSELFDQLDFICVSVNEAVAAESGISYEDIRGVSLAENLITKAQHDCDIWVSGGVTSMNIPVLMKLGATGFIVGRSLFKNQDYYTMVAGLKKAIRSSATV